MSTPIGKDINDSQVEGKKPRRVLDKTGLIKLNLPPRQLQTISPCKQMEIDMRENIKKISHIIPGLYLGNAINAMSMDQSKVAAILNMTREYSFDPIKHQGIEYLQCPLDDNKFGQSILLNEYLKSTFDFIDQHIDHGGIYVHCTQGVSRSSTVVIGYLMMKYKKTFDETFKFVQSKRSVICPFIDFAGNLLKLEDMIVMDPTILFPE